MTICDYFFDPDEPIIIIGRKDDACSHRIIADDWHDTVYECYVISGYECPFKKEKDA